MAKAFTYSRLPEHQVAVYYDGSDKAEKPSEWNIVECFVSFLSSILLLFTFPISLFFCLKVIKDYEKAVIFRLGKLLPPKGPGVVFINPCIDVWTRVDTRAKAFSVPPQQIRTSDGGLASVGAEVQFCIKDAVLSKTSVQDLNHSLRMLAQTTLVSSLASRKLLEVQHDRKFINKQVQDVVNAAAAIWGVEITRIEMSEVRVLKEADEVVGALSALFGGGSQGLNLGNMTFANPGMAGMLSAMGGGNILKNPGKPWTEKQIFKDHNEIFQRRAFAWTPAQEREVQDDWRTLPPGRIPDVQDPFVMSRSWLCNELQQGQNDQHVYFRIVLDQKKLDEALEKVPYFRLFGADICERYFKLFIRGDESSPIMLGELGGSVLPDFTEIELTSVTREVEGHRIRGTMETLPCLDVTLLKAESAKSWDELIYSEQEVLNKPQGSLEDFQVQRSRRREVSPDRADWTPDDFADEQKEKADAAFKDGEYRDAVVYYTRALRHTPRNERLLSNRSGAYCKLSKFQLALDDVELAMQIEPKWPKLFYRKGHALRGLRRWNEALEAFGEGKVLDPQNPDWDKEVNRTELAKEALMKRVERGSSAA